MAVGTKPVSSKPFDTKAVRSFLPRRCPWGNAQRLILATAHPAVMGAAAASTCP